MACHCMAFQEWVNNFFLGCKENYDFWSKIFFFSLPVFGFLTRFDSKMGFLNLRRGDVRVLGLISFSFGLVLAFGAHIKHSGLF